MPGSRLTLAEREEIALGVARGKSCRWIAARLGRSPSTVSRELRLGWGVGGSDDYRAVPAHVMARFFRARRGFSRKLAVGAPARARVVELLGKDFSPRQIEAALAREFPDRAEMRVSHETIYRALFVQGKGSLREEVGRALRCGKARRRARRAGNHTGRGRIAGMVNISQRPAEAADRAVPGHWEGDLVVGRGGRSAVATLAERSSRFCMIVALPHGRTADAVADALAAHIGTLPTQLRRSLTWDQGTEMAAHAKFTVATDCPVYFCDPHSPWQRGTNENTNGLIRYYYPRGATDFTTVSQDQLDEVAQLLNIRPRRTLDWRSPAEALDTFLAGTAPPDP